MRLIHSVPFAGGRNHPRVSQRAGARCKPWHRRTFPHSRTVHGGYQSEGTPSSGAPLWAQSDYWFHLLRTGLRSYSRYFGFRQPDVRKKGKSCLLSDQAVSDQIFVGIITVATRGGFRARVARREGATVLRIHSPQRIRPPLTRIKHSPRMRPESLPSVNARSGSVTRRLRLESCYTSGKIGGGRPAKA